MKHRCRCSVALALALTVASCAAVDRNPQGQHFAVGKVMSKDFLVRLTEPNGTRYRVGVVNVEAGTGMRIPAPQTAAVVEYISGRGFLWAQAAEQLVRARNDADSIRLEVQRSDIDASSCHELASRLDGLFSALGELTSRQIRLDATPGQHRWVDAGGVEQVLLDGTTVLIQFALADSIVTIRPNTGSSPALYQATLELHSVVSGCSSAATPKVEWHDF